MSNERFERVRARMAELAIDVMLLSVGPELPWATGHAATTRERLTMLVVPATGRSTLVLPLMEVSRVRHGLDLFDLSPCPDGRDPATVVAGLCSGARRVAIGEQTWTKFLLELEVLLPDVEFVSASPLVSPIREVKDAEEIEKLALVAAAADRAALHLLGGNIPLIGRTELEVQADMAAKLIAEGLDVVDFAHVGSGPNGAMPHHDATNRVIQEGEPVVFDFGGPMNGYFADITRTVFTGEPTDEMRSVYEIVRQAQEAGVAAAVVGAIPADVDAAARDIITDAGYGEFFIHRLGHGIGTEVHENPYMANHNLVPVLAGNAFSIEPGIYLPNKFGVRIEDIVVATENGPRRLNNVSRELTILNV